MRHLLPLVLLLGACDSADSKSDVCGWCAETERSQCWNCSDLQICTSWSDWAWSKCDHPIDGLCFSSEGTSLGTCKSQSECPHDTGPVTERCPGDPSNPNAPCQIVLFEGPGGQTVIENQELRIQLAADMAGGAPTYSMAGSPEGAALDASTGEFVYRPSYATSSSSADARFTITVRASCPSDSMEARFELVVLNDEDEDGIPDRDE